MCHSEVRRHCTGLGLSSILYAHEKLYEHGYQHPAHAAQLLIAIALRATLLTGPCDIGAVEAASALDHRKLLKFIAQNEGQDSLLRAALVEEGAGHRLAGHTARHARHRHALGRREGLRGGRGARARGSDRKASARGTAVASKLSHRMGSCR